MFINKQKKIKPKTKRQWTIYRDYNATLNLSDITYGVKGHNKYYLIKLIHNHHGTYKMLIEWGRVGAKNPGKRSETFTNVENARKAFEKKFYSKTHNNWKNRSNFKTVFGRYTYIRMGTISKEFLFYCV